MNIRPPCLWCITTLNGRQVSLSLSRRPAKLLTRQPCRPTRERPLPFASYCTHLQGDCRQRKINTRIVGQLTSCRWYEFHEESCDQRCACRYTIVFREWHISSTQKRHTCCDRLHRMSPKQWLIHGYVSMGVFGKLRGGLRWRYARYVRESRRINTFLSPSTCRSQLVTHASW